MMAILAQMTAAPMLAQLKHTGSALVVLQANLILAQMFVEMTE